MHNFDFVSCNKCGNNKFIKKQLYSYEKIKKGLDEKPNGVIFICSNCNQRADIDSNNITT